jgi:hypothetical protein
MSDLNVRSEHLAFHFDASAGLVAHDLAIARIAELVHGIHAVAGPVMTVSCHVYRVSGIDAVALDVIGARSTVCMTVAATGVLDLPPLEHVQAGADLKCSVADQTDAMCIAACLIRHVGPGVAVNFF